MMARPPPPRVDASNPTSPTPGLTPSPADTSHFSPPALNSSHPPPATVSGRSKTQRWCRDTPPSGKSAVATYFWRRFLFRLGRLRSIRQALHGGLLLGLCFNYFSLDPSRPRYFRCRQLGHRAFQCPGMASQSVWLPPSLRQWRGHV
jgi:hypothetical protein